MSVTTLSRDMDAFRVWQLPPAIPRSGPGLTGIPRPDSVHASLLLEVSLGLVHYTALLTSFTGHFFFQFLMEWQYYKNNCAEQWNAQTKTFSLIMAGTVPRQFLPYFDSIHPDNLRLELFASGKFPPRRFPPRQFSIGKFPSRTIPIFWWGKFSSGVIVIFVEMNEMRKIILGGNCAREVFRLWIGTLHCFSSSLCWNTVKLQSCNNLKILVTCSKDLSKSGQPSFCYWLNAYSEKISRLNLKRSMQKLSTQIPFYPWSASG